MMREIHHRIKNSLQLIASILNLQSLECGNETASSILQDGIGRIRSISAIHELLMNQDDPEQSVSLKGLLIRLTDELHSLYGAAERIRIRIDGDDMPLTLHTATSVAIVVNELVTNALKYAFPGGRGGEISILIVRGTQFHTVTVRDNGVGFDLTDPAETGLGLELIRSTVGERLGGIWHIFSDESGTRASFDFKTSD